MYSQFTMSDDHPGSADPQQPDIADPKRIVVGLAPPKPREPTPAQVLSSMIGRWPPISADMHMMVELRIAARVARHPEH